MCGGETYFVYLFPTRISVAQSRVYLFPTRISVAQSRESIEWEAGGKSRRLRLCEGGQGQLEVGAMRQCEGEHGRRGREGGGRDRRRGSEH